MPTMTRAAVLAATDCHADGAACRCDGITPAVKAVAPAVIIGLVPAVTQWLAERTGMSPEWVRRNMHFAPPGHEQGSGFTIAFEGDYDWPIYATGHEPNAITAVAAEHGLFIEPVNGWCLGVYPA